MKIITDERGFIKTNNKFQTNVDNIYAIGDVIGGNMLAHKASEEAVAAVEYIVGKTGHINYSAVPSVIYTSPEIASIGKTEEELIQAKIDYKIGKFPLYANGKAIASGATEGFVKILADKKTDEVLGAFIIGKNAGDMISQIAMIMEYRGSAEDIALTCHPHPTIAESIKEAAMDADKKAINF